REEEAGGVERAALVVRRIRERRIDATEVVGYSIRMRIALAPMVLLVACGNSSPPPSNVPIRECTLASASAPSASVVASASVAPKAPFAIPEPEALERFFSKTPAEAAWFSPAFLEKVPPQKIDAILAEMRKSLGAFVSAAPFEKHKLHAKFQHGTVETIVK